MYSVFVLFDGQHGFGQGLFAVRGVLGPVRIVIHADILVSDVVGAVVAVDRGNEEL